MPSFRTIVPLLCAPWAVLGQNQALQLVSSLLGPLNLNIPTSNISSINLNLITFADEVIDISGLSIFGNVNDGGTMNCTRQSTNSSQTVIGPASIPVQGARQINISLINFNDEVIDFSNVAIFGNVNDVGC